MSPELVTPRQHQLTSGVLLGKYQPKYKATQSYANYKIKANLQEVETRTQ
jgi:hypothetical protein